MENPYIPFVLHMIPRLLSNLDRDPGSPTYGCFDRSHWHYKTSDFPSAILQQSALSLACSFQNDFAGNVYFHNETVRAYAMAAVKFWRKAQNWDGSFDEYWHNEKSIPATAFSLCSICETCTILGVHEEKTIAAIRKAAAFLQKNRENGALNQEMAAIAAICAAGNLLADDGLLRLAEEKWRRLLSRQSREGWFAEYDGADIGYLTVSLDYLARYHSLSSDETALAAAMRLLDFLQYFVHPDGSIGGEYGTRNTEYFLPYGIEYLKKITPTAAAMTEKLLAYLNRDAYLNIHFDERYLLHYLNASFFKSLLIYQPQTSLPELPCAGTFEKYFPEAMLFIKSTPTYYLIASFMKSGVLKVMDKNDFSMHTDCGYRLHHGNKIYTSEWPRRNQTILDNDRITVTSGFQKRLFLQQTLFKLVLYKISALVLGRFLIKLAKSILIYGRPRLQKNWQLRRTLILKEDSVEIADQISTDGKSVHVEKSLGLSMRHSASSRFFQLHSLANRVSPWSGACHGRVEIQTRLDFPKRQDAAGAPNKE